MSEANETPSKVGRTAGSLDALVGLFADQERNVLMTALHRAAMDEAIGESDIYTYLEETPKTSLISELVDEIHKLGFSIQPNKN